MIGERKYKKESKCKKKKETWIQHKVSQLITLHKVQGSLLNETSQHAGSITTGDSEAKKH